MGIRDILARRRALPVVQKVTARGIEFCVKRISAGEAELLNTGYELVAATLVDEENKPLYTSADEARKEDASLINAMLEAYRLVNNAPSLEEAAKN